MDRKLKIEVLDWESNGKHQFIGSFITTIEEMKTKNSFFLLNEGSKKKEKSRGNFIIKSFLIEKIPKFLEYIQGGLEMNLSIAVDFTKSNGKVTKPGSLHYIPPDFDSDDNLANVENFNQYQKAIWSVGRILQDYDHDKNFPVFGFGGKVEGKTNHCFALNFDENNPEVHRVEGIMEAYKKAIQLVKLSTPTRFTEILRKAVGEAKQIAKSTQKYNVLLILTDGVIADMENSASLIIKGSSLPLSIIIVGVGNANFSSMEALDSDGVLLSQNGRTAVRDIVQFVPFNQYSAKGPTALSEEVLKEIPGQVVDYFTKLREIPPQPPQDPPKSHFVDDLPKAEVIEPENKAI